MCEAVDAFTISERFDDLTVFRGLAYEQGGRVLQITVRDGHEIVAMVSGSRRDPYHVRVMIEHLEHGAPPEIVADCTCPMVLDCKHVVAALAAALNQRLGLSPETNGARPVRRDPRVEMWFSDIDAALQSTEPAADSVLYLLSPDHYTRRLNIALATARRKGDGTFGATKPYSIDAATQGQARALTTDDIQVASLLSAVRRTASRFNGTLANAALEIALRTDRVFWRNATQPLRRGAACTAELVWLPQSDATQRLGAVVAGEPVDVVCTDRPWGVFAARGEIAELEFDRDPRLLVTLFDAPAVNEADAPSVAGRLAPLDLPVPATSVAISVDARPPSVHLTLERTTKGRNPWDADPVDGALARLAFAYGDVSVSPGTGPTEWQTATASGITIRRRDDSAERAAIALLTARGLRAAGYGYNQTTTPGRFVASQPSPRFWSSFLLDAVPELRAAGWNVAIADDFPHRIVVSDAAWDMSATGVDTVTLDVALMLDGKRIPLIPLLAQALVHGKIPVRDGRAIVGPMPDGAMVSLPAERLQRLVDVLIDVFDRPELMRETVTIPLARAIALEGEDAALRLTGEAAARVRDAAALLKHAGTRPMPLPRTLRATLRPYQRDGFAWLQRLRTAAFGGILADSMGLGKTVQTIAHLLQERKSGRLTLPALIIAPTSLLPNWEAEIRRFGPSLHTLVLHGARRSERHDDIGEAHVVVTSYALLVRDFDVLGARDWGIAVLDEAQNIKNASSKTAKAARLLRADQRLCLTGTPIENHLEELWSLFAFVDPAILGERERFRRVFRTPIEKRDDLERRNALAGRIAPFILRRTKEQVATDLPSKTEILIRVELGEAQRDLYETIRAAMHERVREALARRGLARSHIVVLDALLKLRQVCCHPRLLPSDRARGVEDSAKLDALREMVEEMVDDGRRILLFSQFTSMLRLIEEQLKTLDIPYVQLTGDTKDRATPVRRFQAGEVPVFLISLKAGGTGLNLTAADTVIHYDPWWNPAVENQATDRAHRIGQDKPVFVYKLVCENTIEERILELQARKGAVAQALLDDTATSLPLDAAEISRLFE